MKVKSTFPARNTQTSRLWRITDAIFQGPVLQLMPVCAKLGLNRPVIGWMSDNYVPAQVFPHMKVWNGY